MDPASRARVGTAHLAPTQPHIEQGGTRQPLPWCTAAVTEHEVSDMTMTRQEVLALPVTVDLMTTARALGIGRSMAYEMARSGTYPIPLFPVGRRYRATRVDLLAALGITDEDSAPVLDPGAEATRRSGRAA